MISFQEVCLMYCGEKDITNIDKEQLIYCIHIYEGMVGLDKSVQDKKLAVSEFHKEFNDECLTKNYNELKEKVDEFNLPQSDIGRTVIIIRKNKITPNKYPRKPGTPSKEPIK